MNPAEVRRMLQELLQQQTGTSLWDYVLFAVIAAASAFFGAYLNSKGKSFATREEFSLLLEQTRRTSEITEEIKHSVARRSGFETHVLLEQYKLATTLKGKLTAISTNLNRHRLGKKVDGLIVHGDIQPLTEVFESLSANSWLLGASLHAALSKQSQILLQTVNEHEPSQYKRLTEIWVQSDAEFSDIMKTVFDLKTVVK